MRSDILSIQYPSKTNQLIANSEVPGESSNIQNSIVSSEPMGANIRNSVVVSDPAGTGPSEFMIIAIVLGLIVGIPLVAGVNFVIYRFLFNFVRKNVLKKYQKE